MWEVKKIVILQERKKTIDGKIINVKAQRTHILAYNANGKKKENETGDEDNQRSF